MGHRDNEVAGLRPAEPMRRTTIIAQIGGPRHITVGPDGNLWTVSGTNVIRIPPGDPATVHVLPRA